MRSLPVADGLIVPLVIHEDVYVELLELLELYCELLISRFGLLDQRSVFPRTSLLYPRPYVYVI